MRRVLLKSSISICLALMGVQAMAVENVKMMIPANPGGGWDQTGRALGKALTDSGAVKSVVYENKGGAAGAIGLAQYIPSTKGNGDSVIVMGAVMIGGLIQSKSPLSLDTLTPIARLSSEYNVFVVPTNSAIKSMKDVVDMLKKDPASVKWGGGSRGSADHISTAMIAKDVGVDPQKINYVPFRGGGEAVTAILGGHVTVGTSGYGEFEEHIKSGKLRAIGMTAPKRVAGIEVPTLIEQGIKVDIGNWRGIYAPAGLNPTQQKDLIAAVTKAAQHASWTDTAKSKGWTLAPLYGKDFGTFVDNEEVRLRALMVKSGMM